MSNQFHGIGNMFQQLIERNEVEFSFPDRVHVLQQNRKDGVSPFCGGSGGRAAQFNAKSFKSGALGCIQGKSRPATQIKDGSIILPDGEANIPFIFRTIGGIIVRSIGMKLFVKFRAASEFGIEKLEPALETVIQMDHPLLQKGVGDCRAKLMTRPCPAFEDVLGAQ